MSTRTVAISSKELESAIEVLSSAGRAFQLTRFERISYHALMVSVDAMTVSLVVMIITFILAFTLGGAPENWEKSTMGTAVFWVVGLAVFVILVSLLVGTVCLALSVPLLRKVLRERAKLKELGLSSLSKQLWKQSRRTCTYLRLKLCLSAELRHKVLASATLRGATKSKRVEIEYTIDHASHDIRIMAVRQVGEDLHASVNGASHA
jgi:hypothetical protein